MKPLLYRQITGLSAAKTLGNGVSVAAAVAVAAAGTGYAVNDVLTASGGTVVAAGVSTLRMRVRSVNAAGGVTGVDFLNNGAYTAKPGNPVATTTGGSGTGATLTVTWRDNSVPVDSRSAVVQAETQAVRWRDDGAAPTASAGQLLAAGDSISYEFDGLSAVQFIEVAASAVLNVTFYG